MGLFRSLGRGIGKSWQVKRWVDYDHLKGNAGMIKSLWKSISVVKEDEDDSKYKDFSEAKSQLNLSETDIKRLSKRFKLFAYLLTAGAVLILVYAIVLFALGSTMSGLSCIMISVLALCFAFRESYNYYLITTQRLKSTPQQWLKFILNKGER